MTTHAYQPGPWPTAVATSAAVMLCGRAEPSLAPSLFHALESGMPASEVAELTSAPLAIVTVTNDVAEVIVRGTATVMVMSEESTTTVSETSSPTRIDRPVGIEMRNNPHGAGRPSLPITSGVVLANSLTLVVTRSALTDPVAERAMTAPEVPVPEPQPAPLPEPEFDPFGMPPPEPEQQQSDPFDMPPPVQEPEAVPAAEEREVREVSVAQTAEWRTGMNVPAPEVGRGYDFVWEDTTAPPVAAPVTAQISQPSRPEPQVEPVPFVDTPQSDHFGNTRMWTPAPTAPAPPAPAPDGRSVLALVCALNHSNPPHFATCRTCQAPLDSPARHISRPVVGTLRTSTGLQIPLDQTVIVGSRPDAKEVTEPQFTRFVTVPSPEREISRAHLAIRVDGWHVLAVDLQSTNGTYLLRGGRAPERIPASTPVLLTAGDSLDLGEGVLLHVEDVP
ncbi:FHA domain-containing protein [Smaragdicoccus niigatensis]|uniref:FHA domain-containing protein n=1 Tax=Smaragdicoccus niigatensis TaxID=359359 RepID=UPI00039AADE0|nr:FHA domain-containing protein [Smaragdicoccus niigatensis]